MGDESTITRLAIEEIVREIHQNKEREVQPQRERKQNPLGKPNKRFLGRTLNSIVTHNRREDERTKASCRRKLKDLYNRRYRHHKNDKRLRKLRAISISSSNSDNIENKSVRYKRTKSKRSSKKAERRAHSHSRSQSRDREKNRETYVDVCKHEDEIYQRRQCFDPSGLYIMSVAATAYNQFNMFMGAQTSSRSQSQTHVPQLTDTKSRRSSSRKRANKSQSSSESVSSLEGMEDENGILTFDVSSDENQHQTNVNCIAELESDNSVSSNSAIGNISIASSSTESKRDNFTALTCSSESESEPMIQRNRDKPPPADTTIDLTGE